MSNIFGGITVVNSFWSVLFILFVMFIGHKDPRIGLIFLFVIGIAFIVYLDDQVNHNESIELLT
jgi:hypothetical protein